MHAADEVAGDAVAATRGAETAGGKQVDASDATALECRGISYHYTKGDLVLQDVDVRVRAGTIHGLIGPNGSGKSTLLNVISGHLRPQMGTVTLRGEAVQQRPASSRARLGLRRTFQSANLVDELDSIDNVVIGEYLHVRHLAARAPLWHFLPKAGRETRRLQKAATEELRTLGVAARWDRIRAGNAPHGVQQLLQLAVAKVGAPSILMLDEPVAGLSADEVERTAAILKGLRQDGVTIVIVEHHTRFIFDICDDVTVLNAGRLVASGPAAAVRSDAIVREVYLGQ
jgi:branched-chain amino acid transport system permease protein